MLLPLKDGTELYYEDAGAGRPVVLVHCWPMSSAVWEPQIGPLVAAGYRVITYDRRGFGRSSRPWSGYDYDTLAADLDALLTHLKLRDVTLIGFSMGGGEVARYIGTYGTGRLRQAVLCAAVPPYLYHSADNPEGGVTDAVIAQFEAGVKADRLAFVDNFVTMFFAPDGANAVVSPARRDYYRAVAFQASPQGTLDCINAFARTDFRRDLAAFDVPTLVIHGDSDVLLPVEVTGNRSHAQIPGSRLVLIQGAPHGLNLTHTAEFNAALLDFLGS